MSEGVKDINTYNSVKETGNNCMPNCALQRCSKLTDQIIGKVK